ncbi:hypothetical protein J3R30DRAFT_45729 [Lentinula aciculospora]|uniref:Uncharacterized protein n=1 Tax=Lentinula aciculospora TaxID=153920 RepID=A0A9W9DWV7_9AGAR|nr:hypothetical protein J3R30DRAFT_45729 [Lentinula aciculospora]
MQTHMERFRRVFFLPSQKLLLLPFTCLLLRSLLCPQSLHSIYKSFPICTTAVVFLLVPLRYSCFNVSRPSSPDFRSNRNVFLFTTPNPMHCDITPLLSNRFAPTENCWESQRILRLAGQIFNSEPVSCVSSGPQCPPVTIYALPLSQGVTAAFRQKITNLPNFPGIPSKANDTHPSTIHSLSPSYPKDTKPLKQQTLKVETTNATIDLPEPGNIELKPGIMITRTFVVVDEDLDAHEADLSRGLIEGGYEVDEGRVDRGAVPSKARTVLGIPPPVHPASSPGW